MSAREFLIDLREDVAGSVVHAVMPALSEKEATRVTNAYKYIIETAVFYSADRHGAFTLDGNIARYDTPYEHRLFPELNEPEVRTRIHDVARGASFVAFKGVMEAAQSKKFMRARLAGRSVGKYPDLDVSLDDKGAMIIPRYNGHGLRYSPTLGDFAEYYWPQKYADDFVAVAKIEEVTA